MKKKWSLLWSQKWFFQSHNLLRMYFCIMGLCDTLLCRGCEQNDETLSHVLWDCTELSSVGFRDEKKPMDHTKKISPDSERLGWLLGRTTSKKEAQNDQWRWFMQRDCSLSSTGNHLYYQLDCENYYTKDKRQDLNQKNEKIFCLVSG